MVSEEELYPMTRTMGECKNSLGKSKRNLDGVIEGTPA